MRHRRNKYNATPVVIGGVRFASKREAGEYLKLRALETAGRVRDLRLQVPYVLAVNGVRVGKYVADFVYLLDGREEVADAKGVRTREYRLKAKLMLAIYGIQIKEL
jgi:hypothetical protein